MRSKVTKAELEKIQEQKNLTKCDMTFGLTLNICSLFTTLLL